MCKEEPRNLGDPGLSLVKEKNTERESITFQVANAGSRTNPESAKKRVMTAERRGSSEEHVFVREGEN